MKILCHYEVSAEPEWRPAWLGLPLPPDEHARHSLHHEAERGNRVNDPQRRREPSDVPPSKQTIQLPVHSRGIQEHADGSRRANQHERQTDDARGVVEVEAGAPPSA